VLTNFLKMFHKCILSVLMATTFFSARSQSIAQLTITPGNPTPTDTIFVISTITYSGNCSYGLVYTYTATAGDTIQIMPTYCGYGFSTTCTSTDTFKIPPLGLGNYIIEMEYHQGSVCPISNFDAVIGQATTPLSIKNSATSFLTAEPDPTSEFNVYPNPCRGNVTVDVSIRNFETGWIVLHNVLGVTLLRKKIEAELLTLHLDNIPPGMYILRVENRYGVTSEKLLQIL